MRLVWGFGGGGIIIEISVCVVFYLHVHIYGCMYVPIILIPMLIHTGFSKLFSSGVRVLRACLVSSFTCLLNK